MTSSLLRCNGLTRRVVVIGCAGVAGFHLRVAGRGIPISRVEIDGAAIREAPDTAVTLWLEDHTAPSTDAIRQNKWPTQQGTPSGFADRSLG